jgi:O-antigen ligase
MVGIGVLMATRQTSSRGFVFALAAAPVLYLVLRIPGIWSGSDLTELVSSVDPGRASSLRFRLDNEDKLIQRAQLRPLFGWGGWGRARVRDEQGRDISITDGMWIIALGNNGFLGLISVTGTFLASLGGLIRRFPARSWNNRYVAPAVVMCVMLLLFLVDCLFNDMENPVYLLAGGGLAYLKLGKVKRPEPAVVQARDVRWLPDSSS